MATISEDSFFKRKPPPEASGNLFKVRMIYGLLIFAMIIIDCLLCPVPFKPLVTVLVGSLLCLMLIFPMPSIRKLASLELRGNMVAFFVSVSIGLETSAIAGDNTFHSPVPLIAGCLVMLVWWCLEPAVYRFMKRLTPSSE